MKQIRKINKHDPFDGNVKLWFDDDNMEKLYMSLKIPDDSTSPHRGATYKFSVLISGECHVSQGVICLSSVPHPNMEEGRNVCCNIFNDEEWDDDAMIESIIATLYSLIETPNHDSILSTWYRHSSLDDYETDFKLDPDNYETLVRKYLLWEGQIQKSNESDDDNSY